MPTVTFQNSNKILRRFLMISTVQYFLTALHHIYGAIAYQTPWRLHIVYLGLPVLIVIISFSKLFQRSKSRALLAISGIVSVVFFAILIGIYEGGYNHFLKNIFFFSGADKSTTDLLFPPATYVTPDNFIFEFTGILQLAGGLALLYFVKDVYRVYKLFSENAKVI